jgi:uncharacterized protein DUF5995
MTTVRQRDPRGAAARVGHVVARMRELAERLPEDDGVAVFNRVYLSVTEELDRRLAAEWFVHAAATGELGVLFAGRYLAAVEAAHEERRVPACWWPLFSLRAHPGVCSLQFALAGITAHVGHDLALALVDTCRVLGVGPRMLEPDFRRVGVLLTGMEERVREELMPGPDVLQAADPLTHLMGAFSLRAARDGAWAAFRGLWGLRGLPEVGAEAAGRLDAAVGLAGRCLLTPLP